MSYNFIYLNLYRTVPVCVTNQGTSRSRIACCLWFNQNYVAPCDSGFARLLLFATHLFIKTFKQ
jgi:hypothetical protein